MKLFLTICPLQMTFRNLPSFVILLNFPQNLRFHLITDCYRV